MRLQMTLVVLAVAACGGRTGLLVPAGDAGPELDGRPAVDGDADEGCVPGCGGRPCGPGEWVTVCAGTFTMGSRPGELGRDDGETQQEVTLDHDFEILSTEVTQAEFEDERDFNPSTFAECGGDCPVETLSWHEAAAYCVALSLRAGLDRCYDCTDPWRCVRRYDPMEHCPGYRLPTEAEWEYAARAGTRTATYNGDFTEESAEAVLGPIAWHRGNSGDEVHPVGLLQPNAWGLYDVLGNVSERTDAYWDPRRAPPLAPLGETTEPPPGPSRGGDWDADAAEVRAGTSTSGGCPLSWTPCLAGFRPVRTLPD